MNEMHNVWHQANQELLWEHPITFEALGMLGKFMNQNLCPNKHDRSICQACEKNMGEWLILASEALNDF